MKKDEISIGKMLRNQEKLEDNNIKKIQRKYYNIKSKELIVKSVVRNYHKDLCMNISKNNILNNIAHIYY